MKDSYSFDVDEAGLQASYEAHRGAYQRIFDRLGLPYVIVKAMSGAMGGSMSEEFLAPIEVGEDTFVRCGSCDYAANTEAVRTRQVDAPTGDGSAARTVATPDTPTIDSLVDLLNRDHPRTDRTWTAADTLKNVVVTLRRPDGTSEVVVIGVPGDRDVDLKRVEAQMAPADVEPADDAAFAAHPGLVRGYIGPRQLGAAGDLGIRYLVDPRVSEGSAWVSGADVRDSHVIGLVRGRDFVPDGTIEAVEVTDGDPCPQCEGTLVIARGIEIGHVFQLGRKYAEKLGLSVLDQNGKQVTVTMGSYGVGVSRAVAAIVEASHDDLGLRWPRAVAPADVHVVMTGKGDDEVSRFSGELAAALDSAGLEVLFDDRVGVSPGVKFKDAELLGMPVIAIVGKELADGVVEVRDRASGDKSSVPVASAVDDIARLVGR